jgi:cell division protein FtsA
VHVGGLHVTSDIAKGLSTTLTHAERLKTLHGSCVPTPSDDQVMISAPLLGEDLEGEEGNVMPRAMLVGIIRPRMEEIFEMIRGRIESSGFSRQASRRVVLTGGASQLIGVRDMASRVLGQHVRLAKPRPIPGLAESVSGPAFSAALGMLYYVTHRPMEEQLLDAGRGHAGMGARLKAVAGWFKENF